MKSNILKQFLILFHSTILLSCSTGITNDQKVNQDNTETAVENQKKASDKKPEVLLAIIQEERDPPSERLVQEFADILSDLKVNYPETPEIDMTNALAKAYVMAVEDGYKDSLLEFAEGFLHGVNNSRDNSLHYDYLEFFMGYIFYATGRGEKAPEMSKYFDQNLLTVSKLNEFLNQELEALKTPFVDNKPKIQLTDKVDDEELQDLTSRIQRFIWRATAIRQAESQSNEENKKLAGILKLKQEERQKIEYPAIRSRYGQMTAAATWEYDQEVKIYGEGNSTISFIYKGFAEKETIKSVYSSLKGALIMYRFKKIMFSAYNGGKQTVIELETPNDKELATANELQTE